MKKARWRKQAALYDPYLDTLGGGEKHILSILKVLEDEGCEINIFWDKNLQKEIESRFQLKLKTKIKFLPNIFNPLASNNPQGLLKKLITLKGFDIFFYVTDGSYFFSSAKKNFVFCMVPNKKLYNRSLINKLKTSNYQFITNSLFTQNWLKKWRIKSNVIYPYINQEFIDLNIQSLKKENIILSVGRFYSHLHSKKQSILINLFKKLKHNNLLFKNFRLIMAGGLKEEDKSYFSKLTSEIGEQSGVLLKPNLSYEEIQNLYRESLIYIHMAGYGVEEDKNPDQVEHLGIAPLEALTSGCLTFCYNAGGPKEIITDGETGFLFDTGEELIKKISTVLSDSTLQTKIKKQAKKYVRDNFNYKVFTKRVKELIL